MELNELNMLEVIHKHDYISQRDISNEVGISLGMVNLLLKKFVKVGIVKAEKLTGNKMRYILTPDGFTMLTKKTIDYISQSYSAIMKVKSHMDELLRIHYFKGEVVLIYGKQDDVFYVLLEVLKTQELEYKIIEEYESAVKFVHWNIEIQKGIFLLGGIG